MSDDAAENDRLAALEERLVDHARRIARLEAAVALHRRERERDVARLNFLAREVRLLALRVGAAEEHVRGLHELLHAPMDLPKPDPDEDP